MSATPTMTISEQRAIGRAAARKRPTKFSAFHPHPGTLKCLLGLRLAIDGLTELADCPDHVLDNDDLPEVKYPVGFLQTLEIFASLIECDVCAPKEINAWSEVAFPDPLKIAKALSELAANEDAA